jgi:hypothetical protein
VQLESRVVGHSGDPLAGGRDGLGDLGGGELMELVVAEAFPCDGVVEGAARVEVASLDQQALLDEFPHGHGGSGSTWVAADDVCDDR